MATMYAFIATKTTYDVALPTRAANQDEFNRRVVGAFKASAGGHTTAGDLKLRPTSAAIPNHLLCDGSVLQIEEFRQLYECLGTAFGGDGVTTFALPDYVNQPLETAPTAPAQTVEGGTVSTGGTVTQPSTSGQTGGTTGGNVPSGGRFRINEVIP